MSDAVWMSYDEVAATLKITPASARNLVRRKGWKRQAGNDGRARVLVPDGAIDAPSDGETDAPLNAVHVQLARLEAEVSGLRELVAAERRRADAEAKRAESAEADRDAWRASAQRPWWRRLAG